MEIDRTRAIEKIKKLLALAQDTRANPNEAANAAKQAEAMMRKYNIDNAQVIMKEVKDTDNLSYNWVRGDVNKQSKKGCKQVPTWAQWIAVATSELFDCHVSIRYEGPQQGQVIAIYGYKVDVEVCRWTLDYLLDAVRRMAKDYVANAPDARYLKKTVASFRAGMATAIIRNLHRALEEKRAAERGNSTSTALVVAKRQAVEAKWGQFAYKKTEGTQKLTHDGAAFYAGVEKGRNVNIRPNPIENKKSSPPSPQENVPRIDRG
jgi:hypothetical protein